MPEEFIYVRPTQPCPMRATTARAPVFKTKLGDSTAPIGVYYGERGHSRYRFIPQSVGDKDWVYNYDN